MVSFLTSSLERRRKILLTVEILILGACAAFINSMQSNFLETAQDPSLVPCVFFLRLFEHIMVVFYPLINYAIDHYSQ